MQLNKKQIERELNARFKGGFLTLKDFPHPDTLYNINEAVELIALHVKQNKKITIVGDYDVDGVISTAVLQWFFEAITYEVEVIIPNRFEDGYGLSAQIIDRVEGELIITVDNGISAVEAAKRCKEKGIKLIITDHHTPPQTLPQADAIINPKLSCCNFQYSEICGAQVAWYLVAKLKKRFNANIDTKELLADVSIAVIADVMPLVSINRAFVKAGLQLLSYSKKPYIQALKQFMGKEEFSAQDIGFFIAPRLNSAGRMEDASIALEFVTAKNIPEAMELFDTLNGLNSLRKDTQEDIIQKATQTIDPGARTIVASGPWHEGVIGIVASHLSQKYKKPAIVLSQTKEGFKGSGRSYADIDLFAIINAHKELLLGFGGHKAAAGLALAKENYKIFKEQVSSYRYTKPQKENFCLGQLCFSEIDWQLIDILKRFEPYGEQNPMPTFYSQDVKVIQSKRVGENKEHLVLLLEKKGRRFKAIEFKSEKSLSVGDMLSLEYSIEENRFQNQTSIQLLIVKLDL
ncbi:MAG: single-stranded-DNA-specific exonuclease RecJ [Campylobacterota bacterium]